MLLPYQELHPKRRAKNVSLVQKYGGTSVGDPERIKIVASRIATTVRAGYPRIAVVVSAMSGETNRLIKLVSAINPNAPRATYDMAVAAGEQVSVALVAAALESLGVRAQPFLAYQLGIITDQFHAKARIKAIKTDRIKECWREKIVPVVAGFQGVTKNMDITTLGRGGSDTSAVALAVALESDFCEINTDVNGVYSADPRYVPSAKLIHTLDYDVALEMASLGSKVLHSRCVELGAKFKLPIIVSNTFNPNPQERTIVMSHTSRDDLEAPLVSGVTLDQNVVKATVASLPTGVDAIADLFAVLADAHVNVDIIVHDRTNTSQGTIGFTINSEDVSAAQNAVKSLRQRSKKYAAITLNCETGFAKVSVVGVGMRSHSGVAGRTFAALKKSGIDIHMISTSEIKISCVVSEPHGKKAVQSLHRDFIG